MFRFSERFKTYSMLTYICTLGYLTCLLQLETANMYEHLQIAENNKSIA
jgi:hypothetical protein